MKKSTWSASMQRYPHVQEYRTHASSQEKKYPLQLKWDRRAWNRHAI